MLGLVFSLYTITMDVSGPPYYISEIYLFINATAREFVSQSCIQPPDRVAVENRFSLTLWSVPAVFIFQGKHLQSIDELLFVDQLSQRPRGGESLITRTGMCLQMYR